MKIYIISFILFFLLSFNNNDNLSIEGIQKKCITNNSDSRERYIKLWLKDQIITNQVKTRFGEFKIKNLKKGNYTLEYQNIFGQTCKKKIELTENIKNFEICTDEFIDKNETTLFNNLSKTDTLTILFSSQGCFHSNDESLKFYNKGDKLYGQIEAPNEKMKVKAIDLNKLKSLILFEKKVREIKNGMGGCTTSNLYIFKLNNIFKFKVIDDTCDWNGYSEMKKEIFGIK